jgi:hypothetical protein
LGLFLIILISFNTTNVFGLENDDNQTADSKISNYDVNVTEPKIKNEVAKLQTQATDQTKVSAGQDMVVLEGDIVTLNGSFANSMPIAEQSLLYLWKQSGGPKIDLLQNTDGNKSVNFIAPNRPNDTRYVFELNVIKVSNEDTVKNVTMGKDSVNILVTDVNKIAKGLSSEPVSDAGVLESNFAYTDDLQNFEDTKDGNGEDTKDGNGEDTKDGNGEDTKDGNGEDTKDGNGEDTKDGNGED